jgi:hypothetical protein
MSAAPILGVLVGDKKGQPFTTTMVLDDHCDVEKQERVIRLLDTSDDKAVWSDFVVVPFSKAALSMCHKLQPQEDGIFISDVHEPNIVKGVAKLCDIVVDHLAPFNPCKDATSYFEMAQQLQTARALGVLEVQQVYNRAFLNSPTVTLVLRDGQVKEMSQDVLRMCNTLLDLFVDCEGMRGIPIPTDDVQALDDIIEFSTDIILGVDNAYALWIDTLVEWPRERLFGMSNASDFLNNQCAMEVCAKAIARHLTGMKVEEMREFLGIKHEEDSHMEL